MLAQVAVVVPLASSRPLENIWTAGTSSSGMVSPKFAPRCVLRCHSSRAGLGRHPVRSGCAPPVPPFGIQITKLSALRGSSDQVVRPSGFRSPSCPPFGVRQITVVRPPGFRSPSCPPSGVCHCLHLPAQCGARCKQRCPSTSTARPLACMPTRKSLSDWRRLGGAATTNPRPQLPCVHQHTVGVGACVFINTRQLGAVRTLNPVQGVSARLLR